MTNKCGKSTEIFSRVVGFFRPIKEWNLGKQAEFENRKPFYVKGENNDDKKENSRD